MNHRLLGVTLVSIFGVASVPLQADGPRSERFAAKLVPSDEVPSVSSPARGEFSLRVNPAGDTLSYALSYDDLEGVVTQAHIHFGDKDVNGGISIWLCSNLASPPTPAGVQPCPLPPAKIEGEITSAEVVGPVAQGIGPGELAEILRAIRRDLAYANV